MQSKSVVAVLAVLALVTPVRAANVFVDLGAGSAVGISNDGTVVGGNDVAGGYYWKSGSKTTIGNTVVDVATFQGNPLVAANSPAGGVVWKNGAWQSLGSPNFVAAGLGTDGTNEFWVAGHLTNNPYDSAARYKSSSNSAASIGLPAGGHDNSYFYAASDVGTFVGRAQWGGSGPNGGGRLGITSTQQWLAPKDGMGGESWAADVSSDGNIKVGFGWNGAYWQGHWWDAANGIHTVPLIGSEDWAEATSVSGDGMVIAGFTLTKASGYGTQDAFIWNRATNQLQTVKQYLAAGGVDTTGWTYTDVTGISFDGTGLAGTGTFNGAAHGWAYTVPEPASLLIMIAGLGLLRRRR